MWLKLPGRIGDSAILGAGVYADVSSGAACATGTGEEIIRCALSWNACALMKRVSAPLAAKRAIAFISKESGRNTAGIVTVDRKGRLGFSYNTDAMGRAWYDAAKGRVVTRV
jgi:beta-aspartyl-peptidase (threonine type)